MRKVTATLRIGNAFDARDIKAVHSAEIKAIVDLAAEETPATPSRDILYCRIPLIDGVGNTAVALRVAVLTTVELLTAETPTLIACSAGMSRSPVIAAAALAIFTQTSLTESLKMTIASAPGDVSAALLNDVETVLRNIKRNHRN